MISANRWSVGLQREAGMRKRFLEKSGPNVVSGLLNCLEVLTDSRKDRGKRYPLLEVLVIAVMGCVCGCDNAEALEDWAEKEREWLSTFLDLEHGT